MNNPSRYEKSSDQGSGTIFRTYPAIPSGNVGFALFFALMGLALASSGVGGKHGTSYGIVFFWLLVGGGLAFWSYKLDKRPKVHRKEYEFSVSKTAMTVDSVEIPLTAIDRLVMRNGMTNVVQASPGVLIGGTGLTGLAVVSSAAAMHTAAAAGAKIHQRHADICYEVTVESEGKARLLAAGLDETTAHGLMADIERAAQ